MMLARTPVITPDMIPAERGDGERIDRDWLSSLENAVWRPAPLGGSFRFEIPGMEEQTELCIFEAKDGRYSVAVEDNSSFVMLRPSIAYRGELRLLCIALGTELSRKPATIDTNADLRVKPMAQK